MEVITPPLSAPLRTRLIIQMVFSFTTLLLAAIFTILLSLQGFSGVSTTTPLVISSCTNSYFRLKFGEANRYILIVFFSSIVSIILQIIICIIFFPPLLMRLRPAQQRITAAYILSCLHTLAIAVAFGKYLTFLVELPKITNCTAEYSPILIKILLAFASADFGTSLIQLIITIFIYDQVTHQIQEGQAYRIVSNNTNNTLENIEEPAKPIQNGPQQSNINILAQANLVPPTSLPEKKEEPNQSTDELKRSPYDSKRQRSKPERDVNLQRPPTPPTKPILHRKNSVSDEESFNSMIREQKAALRHRGPILASSAVREGESNAYRTQGYMSYIRKMNHSQKGHAPGETEGDLIAVIRGKYGR